MTKTYKKSFFYTIILIKSFFQIKNNIFLLLAKDQINKDFLNIFKKTITVVYFKSSCLVMHIILLEFSESLFIFDQFFLTIFKTNGIKGINFILYF